MVSKFKTFLRIVYTTKNWIRVSLVKLGIVKKYSAIFRSGHIFELDRGSWDEFMDRVNFFRVFPAGKIERDAVLIDFEGKALKFYFGKWGPNIVGETFGTKSYEKLLNDFNVRGREVVDIGAAYGDTAIFFALKGVRRVYGFEPFPPFYEIAKRNIEANNLAGICEVYKIAVGGEEGSITIDPNYNSMLGVNTEVFESGERVERKTLENIIDEHGITNGVLKMDCEGYEYEIILKASDGSLRHFDYILMEYHYGFEKLKERLERAGFSVEYSMPSRYKDMSIGYLTAKLVNSK